MIVVVVRLLVVGLAGRVGRSGVKLSFLVASFPGLLVMHLFVLVLLMAEVDVRTLPHLLVPLGVGVVLVVVSLVGLMLMVGARLTIIVGWPMVVVTLVVH